MINRNRLREALMAEGYSPTHCGICAKPLTPGHGSAIDHDHRSGFCRGFLCRSCNIMLAGIVSPAHLRENVMWNAQHQTEWARLMMADNGKLLLAALDYMSQHSSVRYR